MPIAYEQSTTLPTGMVAPTEGPSAPAAPPTDPLFREWSPEFCEIHLRPRERCESECTRGRKPAGVS